MALSLELDIKTTTELNKLQIFTRQSSTDKALVWMINHWRSDMSLNKDLNNSYNSLVDKHNMLLTELQLANSELNRLKGYATPLYQCA